MSNVGYATLTIIPSARDFKKALGREIGSDLDAAGRNSGQSSARAFGGGFLPVMKGMIGPAVGLAAGLGLGQGIASGLKTAAFMEQAQISFETLLGSNGAAKKMLSDVSAFAAKTPFELPGLTDNVRQLLGAGAAAGSALPTMTALGDAAGALGLNQEGLNQTVRAWSQIMGKGKVSAEEMLQITEAGIPIWAIASRAMGKPVAELQKMASEGELLATDVLPLLEKQMNKEYGGSMAKQAKTLSGVWSTVQDTVNMAMANALMPLVPLLTTILPPAAETLAGAIGWISTSLTNLAQSAAPGFNAVRNAAVGVWDILANGDFKGGWGLEEDDPTVDMLFRIREAAMGVGATFAQIGNSFMAYFRPIGEQLAASVLPPLLNLGNAISGTVGPAMQILSNIFNGVMAALAPLASIVATVILPALINLGTAIVTGVQPVLQVLGDIITTSIIPAFQAMATQAGPLFTQLGETINVVAAQIGPILQGVADVIRNVWGFIGPFVLDTLQGMFTNVVGIFSGIFTVIQGVVNLVSALFRGDWAAAWSALGQIVSGAVTAVWNFVQLWIVGRVGGLIKGAMSLFRGLFSGAWNAITGIVRGAANGISSTVGWLLAGVRGIVLGGLNAVRGFFTSAWNAAVSIVSGAMGRVVSGVSGGIGRVVSFFSGLIGRITGAIGNAGSALWNTGVQIIQGLINGIGSMMGSIGRAVLNIVPQAIRGPFEKLLGIHSPSRVFRAYGVNIGEGLVLGIRDMYGDVERAVSGMVTSVPTVPAPVVEGGGVQGALATVAGAVQAGGGPLIGSLTLQSSGNVRQDLDETMFHVRRIARGGVHA